MPAWLKVLLAATGGFGAGAGAVNSTGQADTIVTLIAGIASAATAVAGVYTRKPGDTKKVD